MQSSERTTTYTYGREWSTMTIQQSTELHDTLEDMMDRISTGDEITDQLLRIQQLSTEIKETAPKTLMHYLERKSYTKALELLKEL